MVIDTYVLPGDEVFPEGITAAPDGRTFFVSGSRHGTVFRGSLAEPALEVWQPGGGSGRTQALGMAADPRGRLVVCGGETGLVHVFDITSGRQTARHRVPASPSLLNDVCVVGGFAYLTDSLRPVVWRLNLDQPDAAPAEWLNLTDHGAEPEVQHYLNGIVPTPDATGLIVVGQGSEELWRLDFATAAAVRVDLGGVAVAGDGMVWAGDVLYVCDNSEEPDGRVRYWLTALRLHDGDTRGRRVGRWEHPAAETPTTLAFMDGRLLLVHSQFGARRLGRAGAPFTVGALVPPL